MNKIKKDDDVIAITGRDKGKRGKVLRIIHKSKNGIAQVYAVVQGINIIHKHKKPNPRVNEQGGIITKEAPIHISNLAIYNPINKKADRVGIKTLKADKGETRKVRFYKSNNELIEI